MKGGKVGISWRSRGSAQPGLQTRRFQLVLIIAAERQHPVIQRDRYVADRGHQRKTEPSQTLDQRTLTFIVTKMVELSRPGDLSSASAFTTSRRSSVRSNQAALHDIAPLRGD